MLEQLARQPSLGNLLASLRETFSSYELRHHYTQGEFHHDIVLVVGADPASLPGTVLVVSTNCNGGIKELISFDQVPSADALWRWRCPQSDEFGGELPPIKGLVRTVHWFDPCELLAPDARSELRPEFRRRQRGGGWVEADDDGDDGA
ncbi:MAG: hypothetical protein KC609_13835 [Myxococcales bacterium]|nr:hypothetical protein [Myxococcales bacterium]